MTEELRPELFRYLLRLSRGKKFDIVSEYNRAVQTWYTKTHPTPTTSQLCNMVTFLAEVMLWYNKNISMHIKTPSIMRVKLSDDLMHKLGIDWVKEMYNPIPGSQVPQTGTSNSNTDYYLLRWIWVMCPWLALRSTSAAIADHHQQELSCSVPKEIASNDDLSPTIFVDSSRARARINTRPSKILHKVDTMNTIEVQVDNLEDAYAKLAESRDIYDHIVHQASDRQRYLQEIENLVSEQALGDSKARRKLAEHEAMVNALQLRLDNINHMISAATRIESVHEHILVCLQSCRPSFQTEHLQLEQQIELSKQQMLDLRHQQDEIDQEIGEIRAQRRTIASQTQCLLEEKQNLHPHIETLQLRVKEEEERKKSERNTSFDASAFNRRVKMEGIIARRRMMRNNSDNGEKFIVDAESSAMPHPMQRIAHAAGSFDPFRIADKMKTADTLCKDLTIRQEKAELLKKKQVGILNDLQREIQEHHLEDTIVAQESDDQGLKEAQSLLDSRELDLQHLTALVDNVQVAIQHQYELAESIEEHDEEKNRFLFAMDDKSSCSDVKKLIKYIKLIYTPKADKEKPSPNIP
jgi:hypothetical protein